MKTRDVTTPSTKQEAVNDQAEHSLKKGALHSETTACSQTSVVRVSLDTGTSSES